MNRIALCAFLVGFSVLGYSQDLTKKISVDIPAARAPIALAALGKAAGLALEPSGNLKDEVFVIKAQDCTVDDIMKRVAQAESGKWIQQNGIYLLVRDSSTSNDQERTELRARTNAIKQALTKLHDKIVKQPVFDQAEAQKYATQTKAVLDQALQDGNGRRINSGPDADRSPGTRAASRILSSIDPEKLAQIGMNRRVVFSTNPTPSQLSLNGAALDAFRQFVNEQLLFTQAYGSNQRPDGVNQMIMINGLGTPTMGSGDPKLGLGLGLVVVQRRMSDMLSVQILAADPKLDTLTTAEYQLSLPGDLTTPPSAQGEEPLTISAESQEMAAALNAGGDRGSQGTPVRAIAISTSSGPGSDFAFAVGGDNSANAKLSPGLRAKILDPVKYEPLAFVPGEAMLALADRTHKNIVALLPDSCFAGLSRQFARPVTASQLLATMSDNGLTHKDDGDWIVVSPTQPFAGRAATVNRAAVRNVLRVMDKEGALHLDDVAAYALAENKIIGLTDIDFLYPRLINASLASTNIASLATGSDSLYKFYGTLSQNQRQAIASGQQVRLGNLNQEQLGYVAEMLYNSPQGPNVDLGDQVRGGVRSEVRSYSFSSASGSPLPIFFGGSLSAKTERTILVPNGVTTDGYMLGALTSKQVVQAMNSQTGATAILDPGSLALTRNIGNQAELASFAGPNYDKFRMAHQTSFSIRFLFSRNVMMARSLNDSAPDPNTEAVPYESLPSDFRQQVDQAAQRLQGALKRLPARNQGAPPPR